MKRKSARAKSAPASSSDALPSAKSHSDAPEGRQGKAGSGNGHLTPAKPLRFAALCRVSTEKQEKDGESLRTQTALIEETAVRLGGTISGWYGGQEHATPGYEKKEIARLVHDAPKNLFDAVIVNNPDRWSRDNAYSKGGLDVFRNHGIRFFAGSTEYDLFNPNHVFVLGMFAEIGQLFAHSQKLTSLQNRIRRARRGIPTGGKLPYGRIYVRTKDRQGGEWKVDEEKRDIIVDAAKRYLAGEQVQDIADDYGLSAANLHKTLTRRAGTQWEILFDVPELKVREVVTLTIPELLPAKTIQAIHARVEANRSYTHGHIKNEYLFSRMISCAHCGYAMLGQDNKGYTYYRHSHGKHERVCLGPKRKCWIPTAEIEGAALRHMFEAFGNPAAVQKAIEAATPNSAKIQEALKRQDFVMAELAKIEPARQRILALVVKDEISKASSEKPLGDLKARETKFQAELSRLETELVNVPSRIAIVKQSAKVAERFRKYTNAKLRLKIIDVNTAFDKMSYAEKRELCQSVFGGKTSEGKRMGIWITWDETGKNWKYQILGHLIDEKGLAPNDPDSYDFGYPAKQKELVSKSASQSASTRRNTSRAG